MKDVIAQTERTIIDSERDVRTAETDVSSPQFAMKGYGTNEHMSDRLCLADSRPS